MEALGRECMQSVGWSGVGGCSGPQSEYVISPRWRWRGWQRPHQGLVGCAKIPEFDSASRRVT